MSNARAGRCPASPRACGEADAEFDFKPMTEVSRQLWRTPFIELFEQHRAGK
jgi:hypothetical protein